MAKNGLNYVEMMSVANAAALANDEQLQAIINYCRQKLAKRIKRVPGLKFDPKAINQPA